MKTIIISGINIIRGISLIVCVALFTTSCATSSATESSLADKHFEWNKDALDAISQNKDEIDKPVMVLNLMRFREMAKPGADVDGLTGKEAFMEYSRRFAELAPQLDAKILWMGEAFDTIIGGKNWDVAFVVQYPTRGKVVEMVNAVAPIESLRSAALADSVAIMLNEVPIPPH